MGGCEVILLRFMMHTNLPFVVLGPVVFLWGKLSVDIQNTLRSDILRYGVWGLIQLRTTGTANVILQGIPNGAFSRGESRYPQLSDGYQAPSHQ